MEQHLVPKKSIAPRCCGRSSCGERGLKLSDIQHTRADTGESLLLRGAWIRRLLS